MARNDRFYVRTNEEAPRYKLFRVDPLKPARPTGRRSFAEGRGRVRGRDGDRRQLVGQYMHKASSRLRLFDRDGKPVREVDLPTLGTIAGLGGEWDGDELFFGFQSFTVPPSIYRVDLQASPRASRNCGSRSRPTSILPRYEVEQVTYPSKDGTPITMFLAHKKGLKPRRHRRRRCCTATAASTSA